MKENTLHKELLTILLSIHSQEEMNDFLNGILTPKELIEIQKRLQIVKMLKKHIPHHTIAESLNVGVATVTRGSKELQKGRFKTV